MIENKSHIWGLLVILLSVTLVSFNLTKDNLDTYSGTPLFITDIKASNNYGIFLSQKGTKSVVLYKPDFSKQLRSWQFDEIPTGIAVSNNMLYVTTFEQRGMLHVFNLKTNKKVGSIPMGSGATAPTPNSDFSKIYVCNQFSNTVSEVDCKTNKVTRTVKVLREPRSLAISKDGKFLFVANYLPAQQANVDTVASCVSVIDIKKFAKTKDIQLANGSNAVQSLCLTANGEYLLVVHNLGRFQVPTSQIQQGWMNTSAMSVVNIANQAFEGAVLLDEPEMGAGGLWGVACTLKEILVTQYGTHQISVIDLEKFIEKFKNYPDKSSLSYDLNFLYEIRERITLTGNGPRNFIVYGNKAIIPTYFSDTINILDLENKTIQAIGLLKNRIETSEQKGERFFNDASFCFQNWQSCSGCHPGEARTDGMNWDLMNDGMGNPKNCKSLLLSHVTPPSMISGIRANAELAVRKGYKLIQFYDIPEEKAQCVDNYLRSLKPVPSPYLVNGKLSTKVIAGKAVYNRIGCNYCHSGEYHTDLQMYRIGKDIEFEKGWDTPTLSEVWRTAPYLFNGSAATLNEVFTKYKHGIRDSISLKNTEIEELVEYVNSL
jgi:YVTN family beta-propeller protein